MVDQGERLLKNLNWWLEMLRWLFATLIVATAIFALLSPTDGTDANYFVRSNLRLHMDYGTGCEWLSTREGHLSPRLDASGKQVCGGVS